MSVNKYNSTTGNLERLDGYTVDSTPTSGSGNPVSSGGVFTALAGKLDKTGGTVSGDLEVTGDATVKNVILKTLYFPASSVQGDIYTALQSLYTGITSDSPIPCIGFYHDRCFNRIRCGTYNDQPAIMCDFDSTNVAIFINNSAVIPYGLKLFTIK